MKAIALLSVLLLSGCATVNETYNEQGVKSYALNCSGTARGWDKCLSKAGNICKAKGFYIHSVNGEPYTVSLESMTTSSTNRSMVVSCK